MPIPYACLQFAETKAQVVDSLLDEEKASTQQQPINKLRARRAALEVEKDPRYSGKKVLRKDLKKDNDVEYDPELAKFCIVEGSDEDEEEDEDVDAEESEDADTEEEDEDADIEEEEDEDADMEEEGADGEEEEEEDEYEEKEESDEESQSTDKLLSKKFKKLGSLKSSKKSYDKEDESSNEENEEVRKLYEGLQGKRKGVT